MHNGRSLILFQPAGCTPEELEGCTRTMRERITELNAV
jgi:hypothetical protein